eukprot:SAG31_NODE_1967_length_6785_cov_7.007329_7_plen_508_part_00
MDVMDAPNNNPIAGSITPDEEAGSQKDLVSDSEGSHKRPPTSIGDTIGSGAAAMIAQLGSAPTNWHQATVFYLSSRADQDAQMRKLAPLMFIWSAALVLLQWLTCAGVVIGMLGSPCATSARDCTDGQFCYTRPGRTQGNCLMCGESAPLIQYWETFPEQTGIGPTGHEKMWNFVDDTTSYPKTGLFRSSEPLGFAGFNRSMVFERCTPPIQDYTFELPKGVDLDGDGAITSLGPHADHGTNIPPWIESPARKWEHSRMGSIYTAKSIESWCDRCVTLTHVSTWHAREMGQATTAAMSLYDWIALFLCGYIIGLTIVGEIKDILLVSIAAKRGAAELTPAWRMAIGFLGRVRAHTFLSIVMFAMPMVVLSQGGNAMKTCFNTVAILFLTEVDNLSYKFGLGERARERVDAVGHVILSDEDAKMLTRTKKLCIVLTIFVIFGGVLFQSVPASLMWSQFAALSYKLSEVASMRTASRTDIAKDVAKAIAAQILLGVGGAMLSIIILGFI